MRGWVGQRLPVLADASPSPSLPSSLCPEIAAAICGRGEEGNARERLDELALRQPAARQYELRLGEILLAHAEDGQQRRLLGAPVPQPKNVYFAV
jgi:hypothetical protein